MFEQITPFIRYALALEANENSKHQSNQEWPSFVLAFPFYRSAELANEYIKEEIVSLVRQAGLRVDPLNLPWAKHRRMKEFNENAFTDWFAWTLEVVQHEAESLGDLIVKLFPPLHYCSEYPDGSAEILRETLVDQGHEGQGGRTDLLIDFSEEKLIWHIEVKVTAAESADLDKNPGYVSALKDLYPGYEIYNFILATTGTHSVYPYDNCMFKAVTWSQLCQRLRHWVKLRGTIGLAEFQCLMFCGHVENKLININPGSFSHLSYLKEAYQKE